MNPIMVLSYSFPKAALILLLVLWFGVGNFALITVIVLVSLGLAGAFWFLRNS